MKIPLTIKTSYLPTWGAWEGCRELVQNGKDAETELLAKLTVRHRADTSTLVIENEGCTLPHEALLLGHTTKADRPDTIGRFGEGLKLGVLALVRAGHSVKIRSGNEVWIPSIEKHAAFDADVLMFDITGGRKPENRVQVEVGGIDAADWAAMKDRFLFLQDMSETSVRCSGGTLLLDKKFEGRLYVKGIFVSEDPRFSVGYDFYDAQLDRDRKMIERYDLQYRTQNIWREALATRPDLMERFTKLLDNQAADIEGIDSYNAGWLPEAAKTEAARLFAERYGAEAVPVATLADSKDVEHLGKKGVVVPKSLKAVLETTFGTTDKIKEGLRNEVVKTYGWHELSEAERANLERAVALVSAVEPVALDTIDVVDYRDEKILGMYHGATGRVSLKKGRLADRKETLATLVHEVAHRQGGDGDHSHVGRIEAIWAGIVENLTGGAN